MPDPEEKSMTERVGIVGVGLMGQALAHNLLQAGFEVQGFDVDAKRMDEFAEQGGIPVASLAGRTRTLRPACPTSGP